MSDINVYWGAQHGACFRLFPFMLYSYQQSIIHDWLPTRARTTPGSNKRVYRSGRIIPAITDAALITFPPCLNTMLIMCPAAPAFG